VTGGDRDGVLARVRAAYYRHVDAEDLAGRSADELTAAVASHLGLAAVRTPGRAQVRVLAPAPSGEGGRAAGLPVGWSPSYSVVEVVTDDMPFLVDSLTAEVTRQGHSIHLVIHPQLRVRRALTGELTDLVSADVTGRPAAPGEVDESWIHVEIGRVTDPSAAAALTAGVHRVLDDVREAVEDGERMRRQVLAIADSLGTDPPVGLPGQEVAEGRALLEWLADESEEHFTFLGYREYLLRTVDGQLALGARVGSGLGLLRADRPRSVSFDQLPVAVRRRALDRVLLVLTKANSRSTVRRPAYLDYVGVKMFDAHGAVVGERRILGLFTSMAATESVLRVPVVRRRVADVLARSGFPPGSHSWRDLLEILQTLPRDELFTADADYLARTALAVAHLQERRRVRAFFRPDDYGRFVSALVYLPRDRYTTAVRERMMALLAARLGASSVDWTARVSESVLARLYFVARRAPGGELPPIDEAATEADLVQATRVWEDDFADEATARYGEDAAEQLVARWAPAFPAAYKEALPATVALDDLAHLLRLGPGRDDFDTALGPAPAGPADRRRFVLYRRAPVSLTDVLPVLRHLGVEVVDERPYHVSAGAAGEPGAAGGGDLWIYDLGLRVVVGERAARARTAEEAETAFTDAFAAVWRGQADSDELNTLVLAAGLSWRQVALLRAYTRYLRQIGLPFALDYVAATLRTHRHLARGLVTVFEARLDPDRGGEEVAEAVAEEVSGALDEVTTLDHDRILRALLNLVLATTRTNYFQTDPSGAPRPALALKLDPREVPDVPEPRPRFEVWVHAPQVEGVHLRFGAVARGGLRWSDRPEDFRTEVLGLVKAQVVKNAVIVPTGAKGGFVVRTVAAGTQRGEAGRAAYATFVRALLDVTDNRVTRDGRWVTVHPPRVRARDGEDSYLVVAADKGTASFSDLANDIAGEYGYWLGDAFASGGATGYDHKAMGITARGAWESVRAHFRELELDPDTDDVTVVGIGDMSGDVFGNGMLLSRHIRLVAAFDHRHVFLDPDPDPAASYDERARLFALPGSSWADYDPQLLSAGGGVHPRTVKSIPVTPQVARALGIGEGVTHLTPQEVIRAILTAPVDLLWSAGIGTYVKARTQSHAEVGDKANDAVRVDGADLRARVVGEGGNLGLTQPGRIEYALNGGRINTDAIDNSAGVDTSDHEVNLKILLDRVVADGGLSRPERNALLAAMTDDVAAAVLQDNIEQNALLGLSRRQAPLMVGVHRRLIADLVARGLLDRALESLPDDAVLDQRAANGWGLTSPELAVLAAYTKITLAEEVAGSGLSEQAWAHQTLVGYFPDPVVTRWPDRVADHPLRREITATVMANTVINRGGISVVFRAQEETGATAAEVAAAFAVTADVFDLPAFWGAVERLAPSVPAPARYALALQARRLLDRGIRWLLTARHGQLDVTTEVAALRPVVAELVPAVPGLLRGGDARAWRAHADELTARGAPAELAAQAAALLYAFCLLDVADLAHATGRPAPEVAGVYFALSEAVDADRLLTLVSRLPRGDRWESMARSALRYDVYATIAALTGQVLVSTPAGSPASDRVVAWLRAHADPVRRARTTLTEIVAADTADLATLSVAVRTLRTLLRAAAGPAPASPPAPPADHR
jgi:glutamate dehydrogenase